MSATLADESYSLPRCIPRIENRKARSERSLMRQLKVVAMMPHPDDMEILVAGTLLKYKAQGMRCMW